MPLKVGIVGMNAIGVPHVNAYAQDPLGDCVAICDAMRERADAAAEKYGARAYYSVPDMLANEPDLDVVDICTGGYENGSWHYEPAMQAMEAGKHVLVEKPLSNDVREARELVVTADRKGLYLGCNLNHYFSEPADRARQYLRDGEVGELIYCRMNMGFQGGEPQNFRAPASAKMAGFPYLHLKAFLSHPFSVMRHFCGEVTHVQAFLGRPGFRRTGGDVTLSTASIHVRFANDAVGYMMSQRGDTSYGLGGWWSFEVAGTRGTFCIENCTEKITYWKNPDTARGQGKPSQPEPDGAVVTNYGNLDFNSTFNRRIHAFLEDITNGVAREDVRASGRDALAALELTYAVIDSYENHGALVRPQPLPAAHGDPASLR